MLSYPKCAKTFINWCSINPKWKKFYYSMNEPSLFDVSLRDGLQSLSRIEQNEYNTEKKIDIYRLICNNYSVKNIEIGSFINSKGLPIFNDTEEFLKYVDDDKNDDYFETRNNYVLVPNVRYLDKAYNLNARNFSFITSVSNSFQMKNTKMSLEESIINTNMLLSYLKNKEKDNSGIKTHKVKLYVSCINECPIEGKKNNELVMNHLIQYTKLDIDTLCLSDTCGTLSLEDFRYIAKQIKSLNINKTISLHLHVQPGREYIVEQIIHEALDNDISEFDVSLFKTGGCSVTIEKNNLTPNLSYELYYKSLANYIFMNCDNAS